MEPPFVIRVFSVVLLPCLLSERNIVAATCTLYSSMIIVKSLQLNGRRQIAEPRKYCLVRVIIFFGVCFSLFFISYRLGIQFNSLHVRVQRLFYFFG